MIMFFISDLHLNEHEPHTFELFRYFLEVHAPEADALYILGDLFDAWIGDDDLTAFHQTVMALIRKTAARIPVYFMAGNRDFLISHAFAKATGITLLQEPLCINLGGTNTLLLHGDSLCTHDKRYQRFRRWTHYPLVQALFLKLPLPFRRWIAKRLRNSSQRYTLQAPRLLMDVNKDTVLDVLQAHQAHRLIHGHTHKPTTHKHFLPDGSSAERIVLGDWHRTAQILRVSDQRIHLVELTPDAMLAL